MRLSVQETWQERSEGIMEDKDKKRDPKPPADATPEEIGEFWDTHTLADYWDETHEVEFQVNLKDDLLPEESKEADQSNTFSAEQGWEKLKDIIQKMDEWHRGKKRGEAFEKLVVTLLRLFSKISFVRAKTGSQPSGDARSLTGEISVQAKNYSDGSTLSDIEIEGDIRRACRTLQDLEVYVLAVSRDTAQLHDTLDAIVEETGLDIVTLELTDKLSDLGALCVTFWEDIYHLFNPSDIDQEFSDWIQIATDDLKTKDKLKQVRLKLELGIQTRHQVYKDTKEYLRMRFVSDANRSSRFKYPIDLSKAVDRISLELKTTNWWETPGNPVCYLEGEEGIGKSWLAAKWVKSICEDKAIVSFWLDSDIWKDCKSLDDLFDTCLKTIPGYHNEKKLAKLKYKIRDFWWPPTLIVLDGVNEQDSIESVKQILDEYFTHGNELEGKIRIRLLLTTRPLRNSRHNMWNSCERIPVGSFSKIELSQALSREGLSLSNIHNSLSDLDLIGIPRYFQIWARLSKQFQSSSTVTKEMVLWEDLLDKIKHTDSQIQKRLGWQNVEDAQDILAELAREVEWTNIDNAPQTSVEQLKRFFPNYSDIRGDLEELRIALKAGKIQVELSQDRIVLGWALYLSKLFDCQKFTEIRNLSERFQRELEPIPEERRTDALYLALHITSIHSEDSHNHLSQKRAALMYIWLHSSNAQFTNDQVSYWINKDTETYAQFVEFEFEHHNFPNYEEILIAPLAKAWLNKDGDLNRLASRLGKWIFSPETDVDHTESEEGSFPTMVYTRNRLLATALSILSQRPEHQFLETLARCYESSGGKTQFREDIGQLMRWGYTEEVVGDLHWLAELAQDDVSLLNGIYGLAANLQVADLPPILERPLTEEDKKWRASVEQQNRTLRPTDRICNQEQLLTGESPADNVQRNYHGLDYLAVRTDLPDLRKDDLIEAKKVLHHISKNAELGQHAGMTLEDSCINNLLPWVARCDPESYAELACSLKFYTLNQKWAQFKLGSIPGIIFKPEDRERIAEAILGMKQRLIQDIQIDNSSGDILYLTALLTEALLFSASEEQLTDWFEFLASHETFRESTFTPLLQTLINELLPESIVKLAQQKLETSQLSLLGNQFSSDTESEKITEEDFWSWIYLYASDDEEDTVTWAFENLKQRESDLRTMTFCFLWKATLDSNRFLSEIFTDKEVRKHLFLKEGRFFSTPIYEGDNSYSYEDLMSVLPQEVVGSFLCSPKRRADLSRWGKELMERMCLILQGDETNCNSVEELRFTVNREVLQAWATHNTTDFLRLANEYFTLLSKSGWYCRGSYDFMDNMLCLLLRFQPIAAMRYYRQLKAKGGRTIFWVYGGVESFFAQLWRIEDCNLPEHHNLRRESLEECLSDEEIMFMTLAALVGGCEKELWNLVTKEYLVSPYAKERNLGVSILPWFGNDKATGELKRLRSEDPSLWVCEHAAWAYEVAQQERSCREVYRKALQTRDPFRISAVFEQMKPALSPIARWWREIEHKEFREKSQDIAPKLAALVDRFWYRWGNSQKTKRNIEVFGRKLKDYCRGEKLSGGSTPRIAPWWKPFSD